MTHTAARVEFADGAAEPRTRRLERAIAVFGTWMMTGLFVDGWAHASSKTETFFSPWHGILYSGFIAGLAWLAWDRFRSQPAARESSRLDRLMTVGMVMFVTGIVADGFWHQIFGFEERLEAVVSPSHLLLFIGGFLMVSTPVRLAAARHAAGGGHALSGPARTRWREWAPQGVALMLTTALAGFITSYLSPYAGIADERSTDEAMRELHEVVGLASVVVFNALLVGALLYALRRWRPPPGFGTLLYGAVATGLAGIEGFELAELVLPAVVAGIVADVLIARAWPPAAVVATVSAVHWVGYFAVADLSYGLQWSVELWSGAIVLASVSSVLLAAVMPEPRR